jgi:hypothetical protein
MERIARSMNDQLLEGATDTVVGKPNGPDRINSASTDDDARRSNRGGYWGSRSWVNPYEVIRGLIRGT